MGRGFIGLGMDRVDWKGEKGSLEYGFCVVGWRKRGRGMELKGLCLRILSGWLWGGL